MMKMWGIATSNQGGRGLASFVGTIYCVTTTYFPLFLVSAVVCVSGDDSYITSLPTFLCTVSWIAEVVMRSIFFPFWEKKNS